MVVGTAVFAIYLLLSDNMGSQAVLMGVLQLAVARLDVFDADAKEFKVLSLIVEVFFQAL